jgi:hypothetical protein
MFVHVYACMHVSACVYVCEFQIHVHIPTQKTIDQTCARTAEAWRFVTEEGLLKRHVLTQIVLRMKNRALGLVWDVWLELV